MEVCAELLAVVAATHQVSLTATVTIISSSIKRPITVTLTYDLTMVLNTVFLLVNGGKRGFLNGKWSLID